MTARFPGKKLLLLLCLILVCFIAALLSVKKENGISGASDEDCRAYLTSLGWETGAERVETLTLTLPNPLDADYLSYNEMQKAQGFDLSPLAGKTLTRVTYRVNNHPSKEPVQANLYIHEGHIVAGDIVCTGKNGFLSSLRFPEQE